MEEAVECDQAHVMYHGQIVLSGTPREIFSDVKRILPYRLDAPPMARLAEQLRAKEMPLAKGILTVDEMAKEVARLCK